jgi:hypothetical protein
VLDVELVGGVAVVDGKSERLVLAHCERLDRVAELGHGPEAAALGRPAVVAQRDLVHGEDFNALRAVEIVFLAGVRLGDGLPSEAFVNEL